jgi:hypothetical protein
LAREHATDATNESVALTVAAAFRPTLRVAAGEIVGASAEQHEFAAIHHPAGEPLLASGARNWGTA